MIGWAFCIHPLLVPGPMTDHIEPALTPEEWRAKEVDRRIAPHTHPTFGAYLDPGLEVGGAENEHVHEQWVAIRPDALPALIALANAALPDSDPRKITRETLAALETAAGAAVLWQSAEQKSGRDMQHVESALGVIASLYKALESYLPPE